jgi:hypothetical protein
MADTFQYGSIVLTHVKTESFEQRTEYDPSNTDALWTRTTLTVTGMLAYGLPPATGGETAADTLRRIEHNLMQPRQYLRWQVGSKVVIEVGNKNTGVALERSRGDLVEKSRTGKRDSDGDGTVGGSVKKRQRYGDPRLHALLVQCWRARCVLLGLLDKAETGADKLPAVKLVAGLNPLEVV